MKRTNIPHPIETTATTGPLPKEICAEGHYSRGFMGGIGRVPPGTWRNVGNKEEFHFLIL